MHRAGRLEPTNSREMAEFCWKTEFFHIVSRVVERRFAFGPEEKEKFRTLIRMVEKFSGCVVVSQSTARVIFRIRQDLYSKLKFFLRDTGNAFLRSNGSTITRLAASAIFTVTMKSLSRRASRPRFIFPTRISSADFSAAFAGRAFPAPSWLQMVVSSF